MRAKELFVSDSQELKHKVQNLRKISKFLQRIIDIVGDCSTCTSNCQMENINIFFWEWPYGFVFVRKCKKD